MANDTCSSAVPATPQPGATPAAKAACTPTSMTKRKIDAIGWPEEWRHHREQPDLRPREIAVKEITNTPLLSDARVRRRTMRRCMRRSQTPDGRHQVDASETFSPYLVRAHWSSMSTSSQ